MFVAIDRLLVRLRQVPSRAAELAELTRRLRAERAARPGAEERAAAIEIRALKERLARATGEVACCSGCAAGRPWPGGAHAGGHCCSGHTPDLFVDDEVAMLAQAGTRPRDLTAPREVHAGCAFRARAACTLAPGDRPAVCLRFVCDDLQRELHRRGRLEEIEQLVAELDRARARFLELRAARLDREWLDRVAAEARHARPR